MLRQLIIKPLTIRSIFRSFCCVALLLIFTPNFSLANQNPEQIVINQTIGDGSGGRIWHRWEQKIQERSVEHVVIRLRKTKGGNDSFVNLRYGSGGTFDNGKREYLRDDQTKDLRWNVGSAPGGKPLVLNVYKGEVFVESATIVYVGASNQAPAQNQLPITITPPINIPQNPATLPNTAQAPNQEALLRCRNKYDIQQPIIEINRVRSSGGLFSGDYKIQGTVEGSCVSEAGYYESGKLKQSINILFDDVFKRQEFEIKVRSGRGGQIRAYTTNGRSERIDVDDEISNRN